MGIDLADFAMSVSISLQKVIGEVKRATTKYDRIHDDAHTPVDWSTMLNVRAQALHRLVSMASGPTFDSEQWEKELLAIAAIATSALAHHEREKKR